MHVGRVDVLDPVKTVLGVVRAGDIHAVVAVENGQRTIDHLGLADLNRRVVAQVGVLEHGLALVVGAHHEDIEAVIFAVGTPVVLRALDGIVHLVEPGADEGRVLGVGGDNSAAAAVKAGGEGAGVGGEVDGVGLQHGQRSPAGGAVLDVSHGQADDVGNVPGEADAVAAALALGNVGAPLLREGIGVKQALGVELVEPFHAIAPALGGGSADDLLVIGDDDVAPVVRIAVAFAEAVAEHTAVFIAAVHNAGQGDDVAVDVEVLLELGRVITEGDQDLLELVDSGGHLEAEEVKPRGVDEGHVADGLDGSLADAELLDPGQSPDVAVLVGAHILVLGRLLEDLAEVRHQFGRDVLLEGDDDALLGILQDVRVAETGRGNELGQGLDVGHLERDLVAPLVGLDSLPVDVNVGLLFETLVDGAVVGLGLGIGRESGQTGDLRLLSQREGVAALGDLHGSGSRAAGAAGAAAGSQQHHRHDESHDKCEGLAHFAHVCFLLFIIALTGFSCKSTR